MIIFVWPPLVRIAGSVSVWYSPLQSIHIYNIFIIPNSNFLLLPLSQTALLFSSPPHHSKP
jgi:hypothetical protein